MEISPNKNYMKNTEKKILSFELDFREHWWNKMWKRGKYLIEFMI
mgnify:FL=1|jgi:hypothetical protein|tara:strand:- start:753 stop:887 length:135 start_codon:yes stop_codon:yes gene_type:complete